MSFARDRLVEHYFWCIGTLYEPEYGPFRYIETKVACVVTVTDDIYDAYG